MHFSINRVSSILVLRKLAVHCRHNPTRESHTNIITIIKKLNVIVLSRRLFFSVVLKIFLDESNYQPYIKSFENPPIATNSAKTNSQVEFFEPQFPS